MIKFSDPIDQQRYDAGFKFMPQDRFLAGPFNPKSIDMTGSGLTSLGVSGAIPTGRFGIPRVLNPFADGDGGGTTSGPADTSGFDYEFDALGSLDNPENVGLTEEEQEALDNVQNVGFTPGQAFGAFGQTLAFGPFSGLLSARRSLKANEQAAIEAAKEAAAQADFERAMANQKGFYASLNEGAGASVSDKSREEAGPGFGDVSESGSFMDGGIVDLVDIYD